MEHSGSFSTILSSFGREEDCLNRLNQWFCKIAEYSIIYVGTLNSSLLEKFISAPEDCQNYSEILDFEFTETVKICGSCEKAINPSEVLGNLVIIFSLYRYYLISYYFQIGYLNIV